MNPRAARIGVDIYTGLVVASIGVALAGLTWRLLGDPGRSIETPITAARPRQAIDPAALIALAPFGTGATAAATQATDQNVVLRGIMLAEPATASSALISVNGAPPVAFYIGQSVGPGTISAIDVDHVTFTSGGGRQLLAFPNRAGGGANASSSGPPTGAAMAGAAPPPSMAAPPIIVAPPPSAAPAPVAAGAAGLLSAIGTPAADGLHVGQPNVQMRNAGLKAGDVVTAINGTSAQELAADPATIARIVSSGSAQLQVMRSGQATTVTVPLR